MTELDISLQNSSSNDPIEIAGEIALERGWTAYFDDDGRAVTLARHSRKDTTIYSLSIIDIAPQEVRVTCTLEMTVEDGMMHEFMRLLNRVNSMAGVGAFILGAGAEGEHYLIYRNTIPVPSEWQCSPILIEGLIEDAYALCEQYLLAFESVAWTGEDVDAAIDFVMNKGYGTA